ncbi:hypothetical protein CAEBREN_23421 [Caenorhabditis brenneri]|uniref:SPK domain-containing protein n=1 Tax=Caenorhabditis brenneri TaxID=135651 RepID=G0P160_CAEBE|nr:hypothetical protein CAEBREN_23421 [Caenorhabditis brenneri]
MIKLSVETMEENDALVEYLAKKCEEAEQPLSIEYEVKKFIRIRGSDTHFKALRTFAQRLEKHANVTLNANRKIVKYESRDGSIALVGDQSLSSKYALAELRGKGKILEVHLTIVLLQSQLFK